ncbi:helix-turn-helix domain-containing protein [Candidatus Poseidoniaceae archaeon]|jgi:predicted transcriptional regulator|nr:helix-turn-helix domain-containing protein [Candidatus Poseidoniaceae archaeon]
MANLDEALAILQNKARRAILERLVREPHYPLQLSDQIGISQQAVMKHLKLLEGAGFVVKMKAASSKGGPPKNIYSVQQAISIRIDLGPDLFKCSQRTLPAGGPLKLSNSLKGDVVKVAEIVSGRKKISVGEGAHHLSAISEAIERLDSERDALIALHQQIKQRVSNTVDSDFESYEQRLMVHNILEAPRSNFNFKEFTRELQLGAEASERLMDEVRTRVVRQLAERSGQFISASQTIELPWWAALGIDPTEKQ